MRGLARTHLLPARQRGAALLILLALVTMAVMFALVTGLNRSAAGMAQARAQRTSTALAQAKEALIAYAVTYADDTSHAKRVPGFLPCPDMGSDPEGEAASACGSFLVSVMGRLPWKTLGLDALKDGSGECLWYAVSGTYKNNPNGVTNNDVTATDPTSNNMMNWDTNGQFKVLDTNNNTLAGSTEDNRAVAVIFAPGGALPGQDRTPVAGTPVCGGNPNSPAAYLEAANGINNSTLDTPSSPTSVTDFSRFIAGTGSNTFNDQLVYITRADIWNTIKKRSDFNNNLRALTRRAAECIVSYAQQNNGYPNDKRLPWAGNMSMSTVSYYAVDRRYRDVSGTLSGRLPYRVNNSVPATNNALSWNLDLDRSDYYLFTFGGCNYTNDQKIWYDNWKDQLFYAVAKEYSPTPPAPPPTANCTSATCLKISDGVNTYADYAAVVIFAGEKLSDQKRNTLWDKSQISNYLEGRNASNHPDTSGNGNYEGASASSTFNDFVYAIAIDTTPAVSCYDPASGTMKAAPSAPSPPPIACP